MPTLLRLHWPATTIPPWILRESEFVREFSELGPQGWANLPRGPVVVHGLDEAGQVAWTEHYANGVELSRLLRQVLERREGRRLGAGGRELLAAAK
jgi:hypothetical protein